MINAANVSKIGIKDHKSNSMMYKQDKSSHNQEDDDIFDKPRIIKLIITGNLAYHHIMLSFESLLKFLSNWN